MTEQQELCPVPAVDAGLAAPEGPGTGGNKPLMRNRRADDGRSATGDTAGTNLTTGDTSPQPSPQSGEGGKLNRFRANIESKLARLRRIQNPTLEEIEMKLFWEAYLASPEPTPRALQTAPSEPVQRY